jgi:predicted amidohydrolase
MIIPTACCCGLNELGNQCAGGSNITGAKGELIAEIWDKEGIIIGDVNPGEISQIREKIHGSLVCARRFITIELKMLCAL